MWGSNGGVINAMELFHGTRNTDPSLIYKGAEGFDIRLSRSGMWGQGNYFAAHASYSHGYAYCLSNGCKQMFLVRVLTGDRVKMEPNGNLRRAPLKNKQSKFGGVDIEYDSVTGLTNGCKVFVTYKNDKSYPLYLITYHV